MGFGREVDGDEERNGTQSVGLSINLSRYLLVDFMR